MTTARGHPREWVADACARHGEEAVLAWCAELLGGAAPESRDLDVHLDLDLIGGPGATRMVRDSGAEYFPRVWAARAMRYAWRESGPAGAAAQAALVVGLRDPHWRVREMSAKVVALHEVGAAADALAPLLSDEVPRVQAAAARAIGEIGEHEHLAAVDAAVTDPDGMVARAAERALDRLRERLDLT
ncbi:HEAT repeat domain-containing protein [Pseudactinotalea suaedae]|uniref:HEAT repeat domain-containing protein n=1 Tax=Pseudactinotalea suaedae TaxID=1524924 RepID=UPI0013911040|nr:HEAT repeat domain-containing protein [Pseudactinotalea suaedae]